jgi:ketosteroid isomerase-like protein
MHPIILSGLLLLALPQASPSPPPAAAAVDDLGAEVQRAVAAYNARDLSYYEAALDPKSVYIADDGAIISGRERVLRTFGRIFSADPPRRIEISDLTVDRRGDSGWATFRWSLTGGAEPRQGVTSVTYLRADGKWRPMLIQNTLSGHRHARPAAIASPSSPPR